MSAAGSSAQPAAAPAAPVERVKRGARSCKSCRKAKRACDNSADPPCTRCRKLNLECVFEKPASAHVDDAGIERLDRLEQKLETLQGAIYNSNNENRHRFNQLLDLLLNASQNPADNVNLGAKSGPSAKRRRLSGPAIENNPSPSVIPISPVVSTGESLQFSANGNNGFRDPANPLAYNGLYAPFSAILTAAQADDNPDSSQTKERSDDAVNAGIMPEDRARGLFTIWMNENVRFCNAMDPDTETYDIVKAKSAFLFDAILYTAARAQDGCNPTDRILKALRGSITSKIKASTFANSTDLATVQALAICNTWSEDAYILTGHATRYAMHLRLYESFDKIATDPEQVAAARMFLYILWHDFKQSAFTGRPCAQYLPEATVVAAAERTLLALPDVIPADFRLVFLIDLVRIEKDFLARFDNLGDQQIFAAFDQSVRELDVWREIWDAKIRLSCGYQEYHQSVLTRMHADAQLFLCCTVLRHLNEKTADVASFRRLVYHALRNASTSVEIPIRSPEYKHALRFAGHFTLLDLTFAALFILKFSTGFKELSTTLILDLIEEVAAVLKDCPGMKQYSILLKNTCDKSRASRAPSRLPSRANSPAPNPYAYGQQAFATSSILPSFDFDLDAALSSVNSNNMFENSIESLDWQYWANNLPDWMSGQSTNGLESFLFQNFTNDTEILLPFSNV